MARLPAAFRRIWDHLTAPLTQTPAQRERTLSQPTTLAGYEERFRTNLVGAWTTQIGTTTPMETDMVFRADHTGTVKEYGPFGAVRSTTHFAWEENGEFSLRVRVTSVEGEEAEFDESEEEGEGQIEAGGVALQGMGWKAMPGTRSASAGAFCRTSITWKRGLRLKSREGWRTSTSFSKGTCWCS